MEVLSKSKKVIVFKNLDQNMVSSIMEFKNSIMSETFDYLQYSGSKVVQELNDSQSLCISSDEKYFVIDTKYIVGIINEGIIEKINKEFDAHMAINFSLEKLHGIPYFNNNKIVFDKYKIIAYGLSYNGFKQSKSNKVVNNCALYDLNGDKISSLGFYLNLDGNIELFGDDRDFSYIENLFSNIKTSSDKNVINNILNDIIKHIPDIEYENYGNVWYGNGFAYQITFDELNGTECECVFKLDTLLKFKKPKTTLKVDKSHIISRIIELIVRIKVI
jgi:hypothetical protein